MRTITHITATHWGIGIAIPRTVRLSLAEVALVLVVYLCVGISLGLYVHARPAPIEITCTGSTGGTWTASTGGAR